MREIDAEQPGGIGTALVVPELQRAAVRELGSFTRAERPGIGVRRPDIQRGAVEVHPAADPLAVDIRRLRGRVVKIHHARQRPVRLCLRHALGGPRGCDEGDIVTQL